MPRRAKNRRIKLRRQMSFKKMCNLLGIDPVQRVKMAKYLEKQYREEVEQ